ncbi:14761_t:CDS:1, partial [Acaulospora morrowiae]
IIETTSPQESNDRVPSENWIEIMENEKSVTRPHLGAKRKHDNQIYQSANQKSNRKSARSDKFDIDMDSNSELNREMDGTG